jgi:hypothetical protein
MNLNKHLEFFNPLKVNKEIHIIGVGAVGSNIVVQLIRLGIDKVHIWDFDTVTMHNLTNQHYTIEDLFKEKTLQIKKYLEKINPKAEITVHGKYTGQPLKGYIFLCADKMELRKFIVTNNIYNTQIPLIIDTRIGLETGQTIITNWKDSEKVQNHIELCDFKDEDSAAPVSACGTTLSVSPSVLMTVSYAISGFINYLNGIIPPQLIVFNAFNYTTKSFK